MNEHFILLDDIPYGTHRRQKVDILIPNKPVSVAGIILFIHGGGWTQGDKSGHYHDAKILCEQGYICATMNYRYVSENVNVFDELEDITSALKVIKKTCGEWGFNIEKLLLSGGSAGSHLALLYAYTKKDESPITPVAACVYCPPVDCAKPDFLMGISGEFEDWKYGVLSKCCGVVINKTNLLKEPCQTALKKISPMEYVSENCVPTVVFQGEQDKIVPFSQVKEFMGLLDEKGVENHFLIFNNSDHALDKDPACMAESKNIIKQYAEKYF